MLWPCPKRSFALFFVNILTLFSQHLLLPHFTTTSLCLGWSIHVLSLQLIVITVFTNTKCSLCPLEAFRVGSAACCLGRSIIFLATCLLSFLSRVSMLKHDIDIAILSICLYVHLSIHPCVGHVMRNTLAPFSRATSSSLIVCLYLAYSKLKINGVVECGCCMKKSRFSTTVWSIAAGNNVPSTLGQCIYDMYASDWVDQPCVIHKCHIAAHQWRSRLSQILLQKYSQCNIFLLIINSSGATAL